MNELEKIINETARTNGFYSEAMHLVTADAREFVDTTSWAGELHHNAKVYVAKEKIKDLMLELIGEDEDTRDPADKRRNISRPLFRNEMRKELRKKVEEL
jgi:hypothetical protein